MVSCCFFIQKLLNSQWGVGRCTHKSPTTKGQMRWKSLPNKFTEAECSLSQQHLLVHWYRWGFIEHSPSRACLYYKGLTLQEMIPVLGPPLVHSHTHEHTHNREKEQHWQEQCPPLSLVSAYPPAHWGAGWNMWVNLLSPLLVLAPVCTTTFLVAGRFRIRRDSINDTDFGLKELYSNPFSATSNFVILLVICE